MIEELSKDIDEPRRPDAWDLVDDAEYAFSRENLKQYKQLGESGLKFTVHGPLFSTQYIDTDEEKRRECVGRLKNSMANAVELSPLAYVFHPAAIPEGITREEAKVRHYEFLGMVNDYSKSIGLKVFVENHITKLEHLLTTPDGFLEFYRDIGLELMMAFDAGHVNIGGTAKAFVDRLDDKMRVVHVHDNRGDEAEHLMIGDGNIDWSYMVGEASGPQL
ncbi:MAG: sugar phosphate isomerase/epimerase family protein [Nitrososphaeria archaeon]